jgi:hypothetical protein
LILQDLKKWITSNYDKIDGSNIHKVLKFISDEFEEVKETFKTIEDWENLNNAEGNALNLYGENILQFRGQATDAVYRALIRSKVSRDSSTGDYNTILEVLSMLLNAEVTEFSIDEGVLPEYQTVRNVTVPIEKMIELGLTSTQLGRIIAQIVAAGVGVEEIIFFGTFEYVDELSNDLDLGYSDVDMVNGGTLGAIYEPLNDPDLPI